MFLSHLYIYPIKSLGGVELAEAVVTDRGLAFDRRWMLVDEQEHFLSQRQLPELALFSIEIGDDALKVLHRPSGSSLDITIHERVGKILMVQVWEDVCRAQRVSTKADDWFSKILNFPCRLVYMPDESRREVDHHYAEKGEITSFSDAYPFLVIGQSSLDDLNSRLEHSLPMNRFRPNLVISGGSPFEEDSWKHFRIGGINFFGVKPCARCVVTTTDQNTGERGREPLRTLSTYRQFQNKVLFGQNLLHAGSGVLRKGDRVEVVVRRMGGSGFEISD
jgi:uncharacterized protein YcbX